MKKTCYTRLMALALALMLLLPALPGALAAGSEVQWVDSGQGETIEITRSKNSFLSVWHWSSTDTLVLESPGPVASVAMQNGHGGTVKGEVNSSIQSGSGWTSQIWVGCRFDWPSLTAGQQFSDIMVVTLENGQAMSFPVTITIDNKPSTQVNGGGWIDELAVGQSVALEASLLNRDNLPTPNLRYTWEVDAGGEFASLTVDPADPSKATLTGLAVGIMEFALSAQWDGGRAIGRVYEVEVVGELADVDVSQAVTDLQSAGSATLDIPPNQGLKPDTLAQLKKAASPGDRVTLKHNGREEVTLSFDPTQIDDSWTGSFTPGFIGAPPQSALDLGFNDAHGKWASFTYSGDLPAPMTVTMKVGEGFSADEEFVVWLYDEARGRMVRQPVPVTYDPVARTVAFVLRRFSTYAVYPAGVDPNAGRAPVPSGSGSGSSSRSTAQDLVDEIASAGDGDVIRIPGLSVGGGLTAETIGALRQRSGPLQVEYLGRVYTIDPSKLPKPEAGRIYYSGEELLEMLRAASTREVSGGDKNPDTGAHSAAGLAAALALLSCAAAAASRRRHP